VTALLHDLNHACRYADQIVAMKFGSIVAQGDPKAVITEDLVPRASPDVRART
jgi:iron complex transport system ATP-binding protein